MSRTRYLLFVDINSNDLRLLGCYETLEEAKNARARRAHLTEILRIFRYTFDETGNCINLGPHSIPYEDDILDE